MTRLSCPEKPAPRRPASHVARWTRPEPKEVDVCLLSDHGEHLDQLAVPPDVDSLRTLARRIEEVHRHPVCAVSSRLAAPRSSTTPSSRGLVGRDRRRPEGQGLAPLACKTDKIDSQVLATLSSPHLVRRSGSRIRGFARSASSRAFGFISSTTNRRSSAAPLDARSTSAEPFRSRPVRVEGRELLARLDLPEPWRGNVTASLEL